MNRERPVTDKQLAVLRFISDYKEREEVAPSIHEMGQEFDLCNQAVVDHLNCLERKGLNLRVRHRARDIRITEAGRAALAQVAA